MYDGRDDRGELRRRTRVGNRTLRGEETSQVGEREGDVPGGGEDTVETSLE